MSEPPSSIAAPARAPLPGPEASAPEVPAWVPAPVRPLWRWFLAVPPGGDPEKRVYFAAARSRLSFAIFFGFTYYFFYFSERGNPLYSYEHISISMSFDLPLRLAWAGLSAWTLLAPARAPLVKLNYAAIAVEAGMAFNLVLHTGALTSYFLWIYPVLPIVYRLAFDRSVALYTVALCTLAALAGAALTITGVYPEAAWYAEFSRETFRDPSVSVLGVMILVDAMIVGPALGEIAMHTVELRERELREANASLAAALEEIERNRRALVEAEALAAIGEFVRGAAHEIGNPLSSAHSILSSSQDDLKLNAEAALPPEERAELAQGLGIALRAQERVRQIVSILHELSVHTEVKAGRFTLRDALAPVLEQDKKGPRLETLGPIPDVQLSGNAGQLGDALARIVQNAREFGKEKIQVGFEQQNDKLLVSVRDDGPGFSDKALEGALEPFFTTRKADKEHLGLGLFIARVIVGRIGGLLTIENAPEGGALVRVELPVS